MKAFVNRNIRSDMCRITFVAAGMILNVLFSFLTYYFNLPIYLDTVGTMVVSSVGGLFPGIIAATLTNVITTAFNDESIYYGIINTLIAIITAYFARSDSFKKVKKVILFIVICGALSGSLSSFVEWGLVSGSQEVFMTDFATYVTAATGMPAFLSFFLVNIVLNTIDKGISIGLALLLVYIIPDRLKEIIKISRWRQKPLTPSEIKNFKENNKDIRYSVRTRITLILVTMCILLLLAVGWIVMRVFFNNQKEEKTQMAQSAAKFAAEVVDANKIDDYLAKGESEPGYTETKNMLYKIRENAPGVIYLYVVKITSDGNGIYVFDLDSLGVDEDYGNMEAYTVGEVVPVEKEFRPYLDDLLSGKGMDAVESESATWDWMVTTYYPLVNDKGQCVAYVGADASVDYIVSYISVFLIRILLIMASVFVLILAYGLWTTGIFITYPINGIVRGVEIFINAGSDQKKMDSALRELRSIDISTDDEVEKLYNSICDMALNQAEQMRGIRKLYDETEKMQDGLIITMADLVENRDSDTGAHIQKTAAYVKIIVEGLKEKGYYAEKITPKFMSDVVRSAPLHDVGKINIPDSVLNKPGKLTDEEYEIMKTHTTAGKNIMEKAISTVEGENYLKEARNMAAYHHERWDGKGYPEGLHGEVIPLSARIMAVADVFDALTSPRVYKKAFSVEKAVSIIEEGSGTQFDPKCVEVFLENLPKAEVILKKYNEEK